MEELYQTMINPCSVPTEDTTGQGKLTVGKLYGGVLIYEIWKTTRFSNLEILAKMEEEMEEKEKLERGEIVEKKVVATPSETKTEKTEESGVTQVTRHTLTGHTFTRDTFTRDTFTRDTLHVTCNM